MRPVHALAVLALASLAGACSTNTQDSWSCGAIGKARICSTIADIDAAKTAGSLGAQSSAPASSIEHAPPTESTQPSSALGPVVVVTVELPLLPQRVDSLPRAVGPFGLGAGIDVDSSRLRPS